MKNIIHCLVLVSYDHFRFEKLTLASHDMNKLVDYVKHYNTQYKQNLPIANYKSNFNDGEYSKEEEPHFWIKTFEE